MKNVLILLSVFFTFKVKEMYCEKPLKVIQELCIKQSGLSNEVLLRASNDDIDFDDRNLQCYLKCFMEEADVLKANRTINYDPILDRDEHTDHFKENAVPVAVQCPVYDDESDLCTRAAKIMKCLYDRGIRHFPSFQQY